MRIRPRRRGAAAALVALALAVTAVGATAPAGRAVAPGPVEEAAPVLDAPVQPLRAAGLFDPPARPWLPGHRGLDLIAVVGAPVLSPGAGVVTFAGRVVDRGVVTVDHGSLRSSLEPVDAHVAAGTAVQAGEPVGVVGSEPGHCAPTTCLHWGVRAGDAYVDPLDVLRGYGPIILLPDR
ncbi:M23 family metallopeptidase [Demequina sp. SYSU T00039]|uniref:M23 family metallopeptidase n=1 Tax=Demequina lignilytica TaxID=3051663 RepID=A0AAW7M795_9MICO|nr:MULTISPECIES: M23 family metallopeptidase [unclassified Demequina]MDN4477195.1 M23 family metallopeptidase [Demequina sp. SYSU T00039-1]MDN4487368.1 M23 family metallopeptidase [Demequina sp. SYSU T00039]MDN4491121.1 M23 family metallopeptidase [Demequina sp. SYSU T00068]